MWIMWFWMIPWVVFFSPHYHNLWTRIPIPHLKACERTINDVPLISTNMALFGIWVPYRFFCITVWLVIICYYVMRPCWIILMIFEISPMFEQTQTNIQWEKWSGTVTVHAMTIYRFAVKQWVIPLRKKDTTRHLCVNKQSLPPKLMIESSHVRCCPCVTHW